MESEDVDTGGAIRRWVFTTLGFFFLLLSVTEGPWGMTTEEEKKLGTRVLQEIENKEERVRDLALQAFVERVGRSLVVHSSPSPFVFQFRVIRDRDPNAFAIPGGAIFVTTGLLVLAETESEIAGVLGHEIAHVTSRHIAKLAEQSQKLNIATLAAVVAAALAGGGSQVAGAAATTAMAASQALTLKYTREHETEADQKGLQTLVKAGYDPNGLLTFLNKMYRSSLAAPRLPAYLSTHPAIETRVSLVETLVRMEPRAAGPTRHVEEYRWIQARAFVEERPFHQAISHFESLVKADPKDGTAFFGLGLAHRKGGRLDRSVEALQQAIVLSPEVTHPQQELGETYFLSGKMDQAIQTLKTVRGEDASALYTLGRACREKGELQEALPLLLRVRQLVPEFSDVYFHLGSVYGRMAEKGLSHFHFGKYFKLKGDGKNALLHFRTALAGLEKGSPVWEEAQREITSLTAPPS